MIVLCGFFLFAPFAVRGQTLTINTSLCGCQPAAASVCPGTLNHRVYTFAFNITSGCPSFTAINGFTTSGTYTASDIVNFKLYETNFSVFNTSTLVSTITTGLGPGAHSFTGFNRTTCAAAQRYYWITIDVAAGAVAGNTITVNLITNAMYAVTGTKTYGTNTTPGTQTICSTLPVGLISFAGTNTDGQNVLSWQTASETNNDFFTLERSTDGSVFSTAAIIDGAGTTSELQRYTVRDELITSSGVTYYRLRQTDFNGQYEYVGGIVAVRAGPAEQPVVQVNGNMLHVRHEEGELSYVIYDLTGRSCKSGSLGPGEAEISLGELPAGTYILSLGDKTRTTQLFCKPAD